MNHTILYTIISLCSVGAVAALVLYVVASKFKVIEDPRIDDTDELLPGANCGGCGYPGCRPFAEALVKNDDISSLYCPVGGNDVMKAVAEMLGKTAASQKPLVAVVKCNGTCQARPQMRHYQGASNCTVVHNLFGGETDCSYGCLGLGECVEACSFDAMYMDKETGLPVVITDKCTACNACVEVCPKGIMELRPKNKKDLKVFVSCVNEDKGAAAKKACANACIGCSKCVKECPHDAITVSNFLAYIDADLCKLCRKCVPVCPTNAIIETNFPPRKPAKEEAGAAQAGA
jgi:Na+-translocating ferredoxin:NAD+ oxidoreductase subunit B